MTLELLLALCLLPVFPFSMLFTSLLLRVRSAVPRALLVLALPQAGVALASGGVLPDGWAIWALASAVFYAFRLLAVRDLDYWLVGHAASAAALGWTFIAAGWPPARVHLALAALTLAPAVLAFGVAALTRRYGAARAEACVGGARLPALSAFIAASLAAAVATPPAPAFFALLAGVLHVSSGVGLTLVGVGFLWTWAAFRWLGVFAGAEHTSPAASVRPADLGPLARGVGFGTLVAVCVAALAYTLGGGTWL